MATLQWSSLPADILSVISKLLISDVDIIRLRSVCSSWRSSLPPLPNPFPFPLRLPLLCSPSESESLQHADRLASGGHCTLNQFTFYRLSPPATGDPSNSNGWLFKTSETNPNTFSLRDPLTIGKLFSFRGAVLPKQVNLLDYHISEVCKSYSLGFSGWNWHVLMYDIRKVITLWNYVAGCDFAALVVRIDGSLACWKLGDDDWTPIDTKGYQFHDVVVCGGMCYCVGRDSVLVSFDSEFNLAVVAPRVEYHESVIQNFLVEWESELYLVSKVDLEPWYDLIWMWPRHGPGDKNATSVEFGLKTRKFDKCNGDWKTIEDLGDRVFVLGLEVSLGVYAKDFGYCKGSRVYLYDNSFAEASEFGDFNGVYHLKERTAYIMAKAEDFGKIFLPGSWFLC